MGQNQSQPVGQVNQYKRQIQRGLQARAIRDQSRKAKNQFMLSSMSATDSPVYTPIPYDPNTVKLVSVENPWPGSGTDFTNYIPLAPGAANFGCSLDEDCMNLDPGLSNPNNLVYSCPKAKCLNNTCSCGSECQRDPYTGMCCQGIDIIRGDAFCIEHTERPLETSETLETSGLQNNRSNRR
jgi:hypothetical protein